MLNQRWIFEKYQKPQIPNIIPSSPDDGSLEPKRYSVDFVFQ